MSEKGFGGAAPGVILHDELELQEMERYDEKLSARIAECEKSGKEQEIEIVDLTLDDETPSMPDFFNRVKAKRLAGELFTFSQLPIFNN